MKSSNMFSSVFGEGAKGAGGGGEGNMGIVVGAYFSEAGSPLSIVVRLGGVIQGNMSHNW